MTPESRSRDKGASSAREATDYVKEIVAHDAENQLPRPARKPKRRDVIALAVLLPILIGSTGLNVWFAQPAAELFTDHAMTSTALFDLLATSEEIEFFRDSTGRYPRTLFEMGWSDDNLRYEPFGSSYRLSTSVPDSSVSVVGPDGIEQLEMAYSRAMDVSRGIR